MAAAASLSLVGDFVSALVSDLEPASGLARFGLPTSVTELMAPGDEGDVPAGALLE
jgi:hypothetical protein